MNNIDILEEKIKNVKKYNTYNYTWTEKDIDAIETLIAENKEKDEEIENQDKTIDRLVKEQEEREKYTHQLESENKELDKFIKEGITIATNSPYKNFQLNYLRENFIQKSKVEEVIEEVKEDENPSISSFQEYAQEYAIDKLQSLLGKE